MRELEHMKKQMIEFTQDMMNKIDDFASNTTQNLKNLEQMVSGHQFHAQTIKECLMDMRRARYSVRDFQYIYDISEKNFEIPIYLRLDIRQSLSEVVNASLVDL